LNSAYIAKCGLLPFFGEAGESQSWHICRSGGLLPFFGEAGESQSWHIEDFICFIGCHSD